MQHLGARQLLADDATSTAIVVKYTIAEIPVLSVSSMVKMCHLTMHCHDELDMRVREHAIGSNKLLKIPRMFA